MHADFSAGVTATEELTRALHITKNPIEYANRADLMVWAWAVIKTARGQTMRPDRLTPAHLILRDTDPCPRRIAVRSRAHATRIGHYGPAPLIVEAVKCA